MLKLCLLRRPEPVIMPFDIVSLKGEARVISRAMAFVASIVVPNIELVFIVYFKAEADLPLNVLARPGLFWTRLSRDCLPVPMNS